jgi:hypothetical protein
LGPVWLTIVLVAYFRDGTALGATVNRIDFWFRWILMISVIISTTFSVVTDRLADAPWVAGKLYLFAALLLFGIMVRIRMRPFFSGLEQMAADGASDALNTQLAASQRAAQPFIIAIWVVMIVQANLGIMQPGSPESEEPVATSVSDTRLP